MSDRLTMRVKGRCPRKWFPTMAPSMSGEYVTYIDWRKEWKAKKALQTKIEGLEEALKGIINAYENDQVRGGQILQARKFLTPAECECKNTTFNNDAGCFVCDDCGAKRT